MVTSWDAHVDVNADGSLDVHETIAVRFDGSTTSFARRVDGARTDGSQLVEATLDGQAVTAEAGAGGFAATTGRGLDATWTIRAGSGDQHTFGLAYHVVGAVETDDARGRLVWPAIPSPRDYAIDKARLTLRIPAGVVMYDPSGIAEAGWTVSRIAGGIAATRNGLAPSDAGTVLASFAIDPQRNAEPDWQMTADRDAQFAPAFISTGLFMLVVGMSAVWMVRLHYPRRTGSMTADPERALAAAGLVRTGWVTLGVAAALAVAAWAMASRYGASPYSVAACTAVDGVVFLVAGRRFKPAP